MQWGAPELGWLALLLFPAIAVARQAELRRQRGLLILGCSDIVREDANSRIRLLCRAAAYLLIVVALCRPQWGTVPQLQETQGVDILVALDVSRSMLADDLPPTRLAAAKKSLATLAERLCGDRIGLIAFAGSAFQICPLTSDYAAFRQMLDETDSDTIPRGGSDFSTIAKEVLNVYSGTSPRSRLLFLVSDGEDHGGAAGGAARQLRESGTMICGVTVGSDQGGIIPLAGGGFLKDSSGNIVRSRANPATLELFTDRNVRLDGGGEAIARIYEDVRPLLLQRAIKSSSQIRIERFQIPLALALLLLVTEFFLCGAVRK